MEKISSSIVEMGKMIGDIPAGTEVILTAHSNGIDMDFHTIVTEKNNEKLTELWIKPIRRDGKILNFSKVFSDITVILDNRAYNFKVDQIKIIKHKNDYFYLITSMLKKDPINRRKCVRVRYCVNAIFQPGSNRATIDCLTEDISIAGVALNINKEVNYSIGTKITVSIVENQDIILTQLKGKIVRCEYNEETGKTKICIAFEREYEKVVQLVARIQRLELARLRDKGKI